MDATSTGPQHLRLDSGEKTGRISVHYSLNDVKSKYRQGC